MRAHVSVFAEPKMDSPRDSYEDAWSVGSTPLDEPVEFRELQVAIADGASEALLAKFWAQRLVRELTTGNVADRRSYHRALRRAIDAWPSFLTEYVSAREAGGRPIQWYEEPGLARGAYATTLSLRLRTHPAMDWHCLTSGDACFFQVRDEELLSAHPLTASAEFGSSPVLVPSRPLNWEAVKAKTLLREGTWASGDLLLLMTDALASWFLVRVEEGQKPWDELRDLGTVEQPHFPDWVASQRLVGGLKDDDTTLLRIDLW